VLKLLGRGSFGVVLLGALFHLWAVYFFSSTAVRQFFGDWFQVERCCLLYQNKQRLLVRDSQWQEHQSCNEVGTAGPLGGIKPNAINNACSFSVGTWSTIYILYIYIYIYIYCKFWIVLAHRLLLLLKSRYRSGAIDLGLVSAHPKTLNFWLQLCWQNVSTAKASELLCYCQVSLEASAMWPPGWQRRCKCCSYNFSGGTGS
jgi:hypothetical protein